MRPALLLALALTACAPQSFVAQPSEYAAYRATRVGRTFEDRIAAAHVYLLDYPDGWFKAEVRAFFDPAEAAFYATSSGTEGGLRAYLKALPRGPHREEARRRILQIEVAARVNREQVERDVAAVEARISGAAVRERAEVQKTFDGWLARLLDPALYDAPLHAADAGLLVPFALSLPSPRCTTFDPPDGGIARRCVKLLSLPYTVEADHGLEPREATLEITLAQDPRGVPLEAFLAGPDLFSRLEETHRVKPLPADDTALRAQAVSRAVDGARAIFAQAVDDKPACRKKPTPPTVMELACGGVRLTALPGTKPGEDDRLEIRPLGP